MCFIFIFEHIIKTIKNMKCFFVIFKIRTYLTLRPANFITTGSPVFRISYANDYMIIFVWAR